MEITDAQYRHIEPCLPTHRGNVTLDNLQVLNAILYVAEQGCKWRGLPKRFGNWHTIYMRMNRWSKSGVLDRVFAQLQHMQIIRVRLEAVALDSTIVKVHPDGTGALKKRPASHWPVPRRMDDQDSSGCRGCSNGHNLCPVPGPGPRCTGGTNAAAPRRENAAPDPPGDGSGI
jgi:transposase